MWTFFATAVALSFAVGTVVGLLILLVVVRDVRCDSCDDVDREWRQ